MSTTSHNLFKLNGEYVKFFTTSNKILPELYKNSGAIIIYSDNNDQDRKYIYLGGEMIASGYGVKNEDVRNSLEKISDSYSKDIKSITSSIDSVSKEVTDLKNTFNNEAIFNDGDISSTTITLGNQKVKLKDFLLNTVNAKYTGLEITNQVNVIQYKTTASDIERTITFSSDDIVYLPVGAMVTSISTTLSIVYNDTGGVQQVDATFYQSTPTISNNKLSQVKIDNVDGNGNLIFPKQYEIDEISSKKELTIKYVYQNDHQYFINEGENILIDNIKVDSYQTIKFKSYTQSTFVDDESSPYDGIYSIENIIAPQQHIVPSVKVYGKLCALYQTFPANEEGYSLDVFSEKAKRTPIFNDYVVSIPLARGMNKFIFAIPSTYQIKSGIYCIGRFEKNWSGNINKSYVNKSETHYVKLYQPFNDRFNIQLLMNYDFYYLIFDESNTEVLQEDAILKLILYKDNNSNVYSTGQIPNIKIIDNNYYRPLLNENFNSLYWHSSKMLDTLDFMNEYYITNNDDFFENPLKYKNEFTTFSTIDELTSHSAFSFNTPGKLYILLPKFYKDGVNVKINGNIEKNLSEKLIIYKDCVYIILYTDNKYLTTSDKVTFEKIHRLYIGNEVQNAITPEKYFTQFKDITGQSITNYTIQLDEKHYLGFLYIIVADETLNGKKLTITFESPSKIDELEYTLYTTFIMYDTIYSVYITDGQVDNIESGSKIIINKQ